MQIIVRLLLFTILVVISNNVLIAQNNSSLKVELIDQNSNIILQGEVRLNDKNGKIVNSKKLNGKSYLEFERLVMGELGIEVNSPGFEMLQIQLTIKDGINLLTLKLEVKKIEEKVLIEPSEIDRRLNQAFSRMMDQKEIDSLPNESSEIRKELQRRFGDEVIIRVNGFMGGQIPPKEAIRSIEVSLSSFDAEFHELGRPIVNIITKASVPNLIASIGFNYGNSALNARNAFASNKLPEQNRLIFGFLTAPLKKTSSFSISFNDISNVREEIIIAKTIGITEPTKELSTISSQNFSGELNTDIGKDFTLRMSHQYTGSNLKNAGVGGFNLSERGYSSNNQANEFRISLNGTIAERFSTQFRSQFSFEQVQNKSNSNEIGINVADSFNIGGAGIDNASNNQRNEIFQMIGVGKGKHSVKFGGQWSYQRQSLISSDGINGRFFYKNIDDYLLLRPSTYIRSVGTNNLSFGKSELALFIQDDYRLLKQLQIGFGLRYELQNRLSDRNNFAPRLSAAVVIDKKARFVLRTGAGILYDWYDSNQIQQVLSNNGSQSNQLIIINPSFPDPSKGGILKEQLAPSVIKQASNLANPYLFVTQTILSINQNQGLKFDISYKYEKGIHLFRSRDINSPIEGVRPNNQFGRILQLESSGNFNKNSFNFSGTGVLFKRVRVQGRYTLSKAVDDFDGVFSLPTDSYNLRLDRGISNLDVRHSSSIWFDFSPFKDFRINPFIIINSPRPYTITSGQDNNKDSAFNDRPIGVLRNSERGSWSKTVNLSINWSIPFLKRNFKSKKVGQGEDIKNVPDFLKYRKINLTVSINNLFNSTNFGGFVGNHLSPFFGQPTFAAPARSITFNLLYTHF